MQPDLFFNQNDVVLIWINIKEVNFLLFLPMSFLFVARFLLNNSYHIRKLLLLPLKSILELKRLSELDIEYPYISINIIIYE